MKAINYHLTILGPPKAQGRPRARNAGKFIQIYDEPKSARAKKTMAQIVQEQAPDKLLDCPLCVDLVFFLPRPKGHYGSGRNEGILKSSSPHWHTKRPDIDNLRKLVMDALTGVFWLDDSIVCQGRTEKIYDEKPRTEIFITEAVRNE